MLCYRITKYNPVFRDSSGSYTKNEWTSFADVNKIFDGQIFALDEYLCVERAYCDVVMKFMDCLRVTHLYINSLEKNHFHVHKKRYTADIVAVVALLKEGMALEKKDIVVIIPLVLREIIWLKLDAPTMFAHFGYDYYMYVGSEARCISAITYAQENGLFVDGYESPYMD